MKNKKLDRLERFLSEMAHILEEHEKKIKKLEEQQKDNKSYVNKVLKKASE